MRDPTCGVCRKPIEPDAKVTEIGDQRFHTDCLRKAAELNVARALAEADTGNPL